MLNECFNYEEKVVSYDFMRHHLTLLMNKKELYDIFLNQFLDYFLSISLSPKAREWVLILLSGEQLGDNERNYLKNTLRRVFTNKEHFKGLVGEYILGFYYKNICNDYIWSFGPKGRSSAEPGIDYIVFVGDDNNLESIKFIAWESKTTQNSATTRASEIYDFFSKDGSFEENIDCEITSIQELFKNTPDNNLKQVVSNMQMHVLNRDNKLNIGACAILTNNLETTDGTFKSFEKCFPELSKEQRYVKFIFFELLGNIMTDLEEIIWKRL